ELVRSHNHLLDWYPGADGIKTGFINDSGFNLAASAVRNGHRLIGVVMGGRSWRSRDREMGNLLDLGFADLGGAQRPTAPVIAASSPAAAPAQAAPIQAVAPASITPAPTTTAHAVPSQGSADPASEPGRDR